MADLDLARRYVQAISTAAQSAIAAEPEAQLTVPVKELFEALSPPSGSLVLVREAQLNGLRPDFGGLFEGRPCGWVELKAPAKSIDGQRWRGREAKQWRLLAELDSLIVSNGVQAQLYRLGSEIGAPVDLPSKDNVNVWNSTPLRELILRFTALRPTPIRRVADLATRLAPLTKLLRDRIIDVLSSNKHGPMHLGMSAWETHVHNGVTKRAFANDLSQVVSYSMAIAALRGGADLNKDNLLALGEARHAIAASSPVLSAALGPVLGVKGLLGQIEHEVAAIERLASSVDAKAVAGSTDPRGEPWLWFYEDFLQAFDPEARKKAGVYYTPTDIVQFQVRTVQDVLCLRFGRNLGFADPGVVTLDPACGSGTYPLSIIDAAATLAAERRGPAGPAQIAANLARNLISFELMPGPYAVAHLRIGQRIAEISGQLLSDEVRVYLTDTLDDPNRVAQTIPLWGDVDVLAEERRRAQSVKRDEEVMVVIGNPPYDRVSHASGAGGWVAEPGSLFDDILATARARTKFSHIASLYNLYVYFWRWALWKVFESSGDGPAVVSFITASSWLSGPGFVGLRSLVQSLGDEVWICDLGGDNRGTRLEENVFAIETPVAIVTIVRDHSSNHDALPTVYYRRVSGSRLEKLTAVRTMTSPQTDAAEWDMLPILNFGEVMLPKSGGSDWHSMPALAQLFPWQYPGVKANRTWPIAPSRSLLGHRWDALLNRTTADGRAEAFITPTTGRNIHTRVRGLPPISTLPAGTPVPSIARYSFRSFDRQWIINDPRVLALERPALWSSISDRQIFFSTMMTTPLGQGSAMTVAAHVPDLHHFRGNFGGKDVIPLYRDAKASQPNVTQGLLEAIGTSFRELDPIQKNPDVEELAAYVYCLLSSPAYYEHFEEELGSPGPRVPVTKSSELFRRTVAVGRELIWLHTFGERYGSRSRPGLIQRDPDVYWTSPVSKIPWSSGDITHDVSRCEIHIGDGVVRGVDRSVWSYSVNGWPVVQRWLAYRTAKGYGRAATRPGPLDQIRPNEWQDEWNDELLDLLTVLKRTIDLQDIQRALLDEVCAGPLISGDVLPSPKPHETKEPKS